MENVFCHVMGRGNGDAVGDGFEWQNSEILWVSLQIVEIAIWTAKRNLVHVR
jgi:hypothetical protein